MMMMGRGLTSSQLSDLMNTEPIRKYFRGVYAADQLNTDEAAQFLDFNSKKNLYICNGQPSGSQGDHWFLLGTIDGMELGLFFDSLGDPAPDFVESFLTERCSCDKWSEFPYRSQGNSALCGCYCLHVAYHLCNSPKSTFVESIRGFSKTDWDGNDRAIIKSMKTLFNLDVSDLQ